MPGARGHSTDLLTIAAGLALAAAPALLAASPAGAALNASVHARLVAAPAAACAARQDGPADFNLDKLNAAYFRFAGNSHRICLALGAALALVGGARVWARRRARSGPFDLPLAAPLLAALLLGAAELAAAARLAAAAAEDGLFTESAAERERRFFGRAVDAAAQIRAAMPENARFVATDSPESNEVYKVGWLAFPRRLYMPPHSLVRASAADLRAAFRDTPAAAEWCRARGFSFAVDLRALLETGDPAAIVPVPGAGP